jgi:hypothetical protein
MTPRPPLGPVDSNRAPRGQTSLFETMFFDKMQADIAAIMEMQSDTLQDKVARLTADRKRKIGETESDLLPIIDRGQFVDDDDDVDPSLYEPTMHCDQVRRRINNVINSNEMKIGEFQSVLNVTAHSFNTFLRQTGKYKGDQSKTYAEALRFFNQRARDGVKEPRKKATSATNSSNNTNNNNKTARHAPADDDDRFDVSAIHLPGEENVRVSVYESCDVVRRKIRDHLRDPAVTQASFLRALARSYPDPTKKIQSTSLSRFQGQSGANAGATSSVHYAAYVFFEKLRIRNGKPKSKHREGMEGVWGVDGMDLKVGSHTGMFVGPGTRGVYVDEYGRHRQY